MKETYYITIRKIGGVEETTQTTVRRDALGFARHMSRREDVSSVRVVNNDEDEYFNYEKQYGRKV